MSCVLVRSEEDTAQVARILSGQIAGGMTIGLSGDLGAGKTTLVRYLVAALGGNSREVSSPSFTLEHEYSLAQDARVDHWDLYRVRTLPDELREPPDRDTIRIVEWPDACSEFSGYIDLTLTIKVVDSTGRHMECGGPLGDKVLAALLKDMG